MTANTLSNSDRAKVASAVTGRMWVHSDSSGNVFIGHGDGSYEYWQPDFSIDRANWFICRDQALALVEYLADSGDSNYQSGAIRCVQRRDVESLMQLAHQMITKGKEDE